MSSYIKDLNRQQYEDLIVDKVHKAIKPYKKIIQYLKVARRNDDNDRPLYFYIQFPNPKGTLIDVCLLINVNISIREHTVAMVNEIKRHLNQKEL